MQRISDVPAKEKAQLWINHDKAQTDVILAGFDPLYAEGEAYATRLQAEGVPVSVRNYPGQMHGFLARQALAESLCGNRGDSGAAQGRVLKAALPRRARPPATFCPFTISRPRRRIGLAWTFIKMPGVHRNAAETSRKYGKRDPAERSWWRTS